MYNSRIRGSDDFLAISSISRLRSLYIGSAVKFASLVPTLKNVTVDGGR